MTTSRLTRREQQLFLGPKPRKQISLRLDQETMAWLDREAFVLSSRPPYHDISMSDVIRYAIRMYREVHGDAKPAVEQRPSCSIVETTAGSYCAACARRAAPGETIVCGDADVE